MFTAVDTDTIMSEAKRHARRWSHNEDELQELQSVVLLALCENCNTVNNADTPLGVIATIAKRTLINHWQYEQQRVTRELPETFTIPGFESLSCTRLDIQRWLDAAGPLVRHSVQKRLTGSPASTDCMRITRARDRFSDLLRYQGF